LAIKWDVVIIENIASSDYCWFDLFGKMAGGKSTST